MKIMINQLKRIIKEEVKRAKKGSYIDAIKNEKELSGWGTWAATGEFYSSKVVIINDADMGTILM